LDKKEKLRQNKLINKPFTIIDCDKNLGVAFISNDNYKKISLAHLNSSLTYKRLETNQLDSITNEINVCLNDLKNNKHISNQLYEKLLIKNKCNLGKFRILAKVHKDKFGIRPIINCSNQPTEKICIVIDLIFKCLLKDVKHILKDSQQLLQIFEKIFINKKPFLYSMDFESLYTSIVPEKAITLICDFMSNRLDSVHLDITALYVFLKLIFTKNIFSFLLWFYIQTLGIAMGCRCGPSLANLYLYILEFKWIDIHRPLGYFRFIDDIFLISENEINLNEFKQQFDYLKLNILISDSVNFLDLNIMYDCFKSKLKFILDYLFNQPIMVRFYWLAQIILIIFLRIF